MAQVDTAAPSLGAAHASVAADEEQTFCALSGEKFDLYWDEDHQEWRYRDAKRLNADEAGRYGLSEGALVLVSALSGAPAVVTARPKAEDAKIDGHATKDGCTADEEPAAKRLKVEG
jgi:pre-mRNA cleavage complex 2 protein Pcf11